ncbi:MAG: acetate kinase [Fusobacteria bacterium]|nr:acetate kinase [Fusobacteriota bacterium]
MDILVVNAGSSSLKFQLYNMDKNEVIAKGICERVGVLGGDNAYLEFKSNKIEKEIEINKAMPTHKEAIELMLAMLKDEKVGVIKELTEIDAIGHRIVHGEEFFKESVLIDDEVIKKMEEFEQLAPLHMPPNILGVKSCMELIPGKPNVAVFDTAFHQTMPDYAFTYALPYEDYKDLKVRKYGFHGTSHKYVSEETIELLNNKPNSKIITCHLGNGSSITAIKDGKVIDTSMGLTPLEGLMMGTRCGSVDPAAVLYVMEKRNLNTKEMDNYMNKKSGIIGIYEKNSDFREVRNDYLAGDERATLTFNMITYKIKQYIGSYAASLGGLDAIVFTGGIGENSAIAREKICENLEFLGVNIDSKINIETEENRTKKPVLISTVDSKVKVFKINTNEELAIAKDTYNIVKFGKLA